MAAQTISNSVADSMEFMQQECAQFENVGPTVKYIRMINDIFDIMNSTTSETATGFKRAISKSTAAELFRRFEEAIVYMKQLKVEGESKSIFQSSVNTPFTGFFCNIISFMSIYDEYILTDKMDKIICHRFCQDLLESFFGSIRSMGGENLCYY